MRILNGRAGIDDGQPTRQGTSILDYVMSSRPERVQTMRNSDCDLGDHHLLVVDRKQKKRKKRKGREGTAGGNEQKRTAKPRWSLWREAELEAYNAAVADLIPPAEEEAEKAAKAAVSAPAMFTFDRIVSTPG